MSELTRFIILAVAVGLGLLIIVAIESYTKGMIKGMRDTDDAIKALGGVEVIGNTARQVASVALKEIHEENFRLAVEAEKLRLKRPWWIRVFPWRIVINIKRR